MAVKAALSYTIEEAARALRVTPATIRNWIKDGLPVMSSRKPYLLLGQDIRDYLRAKNKAAKRPLEEDGLFCPSCKRSRRPTGMAVALRRINPKTGLLLGTCDHCGCASTRMISTARIEEFAQTFTITKQANSEA